VPTLNPYPWSSLPRVTSHDREAVRQARSYLGRYTNFSSLVHAASELLHCPVEVQLRGIAAAALKPPVQGIRFALRHEEDAPPLDLEFETTFAATLVAKALGRAVPLLDPTVMPSATLIGATGAFLALAARRSGQPWRLSLPLPTDAAPVAIASLLVRLGAESFLARALVPLPKELVAPPLFDAHALSSLGEVPLTLPLVISAAEATREDLEAIDPGAAWCLSESCRMRDQGQGWQGHALLLGPTSERGLPVSMHSQADRPEPFLVLEAGSVSSPWAPTDLDEDEPARWIVRCEAGHVTLPASVWAAQKPGDRIALTHWAPQHVVVRVSSAPLATGQLTWLTTEAAVRITSRFPLDLPPLASENTSNHDDG